MITKIQAEIAAEYRRANELHGHFASPHEAYAVLIEEVEEFWAECKKKRPNKYRMHDEMVQVGAMALKFLIQFKI